MLWRIQPDLVIELGTSGGGSSNFFGHIMEQYNPRAKILTMDPAMLKLTGQRELVDWNYREIKEFCPHCRPANTQRPYKWLKRWPLPPRA